ncbi:hypothetical protein ABIC60_001635 [Phyllobacterium ifriqiyense]
MREYIITPERWIRDCVVRKRVQDHAYNGALADSLEQQIHGRYEAYRAAGKSSSLSCALVHAHAHRTKPDSDQLAKT